MSDQNIKGLPDFPTTQCLRITKVHVTLLTLMTEQLKKLLLIWQQNTWPLFIPIIKWGKPYLSIQK